MIHVMLEKLKKCIVHFWTRSIRRQLMLGIMLVHAVLMSIFVYDLTNRQQQFLHEQSRKQAASLAETLAANSVSWVLANDIIGMEEVIQSQNRYPDLKYAMILAPDGRVLSHTQQKNTGLYATDEISQSLLEAPQFIQPLHISNRLIDIAAPIIANEELIAWARVGLGQDSNRAGLDIITRDGLVYTVIAILVGAVFAFFMARGITASLRHLLISAGKIAQGDRQHRVEIDRVDEIGQLATDFNLMLDAVTEQGRELNESEKRWQFALEGSQDGIWDWDVKNNTVFFSDRWIQLLGYERHEISHDFDEWYQRVHPDDIQKTMQSVEDHLNGKTTAFHTEHRLKTKQGDYLWVMGRGKVIEKDSDGSPLRVIGTMSDISKRKNAEQQREALIEELEHKNSELERFTYTVSHDLKSPIVTIKGFLSLLETDVKNGDENRINDDINRINKATDKMQALLNDLLELSRIGRLINPPETTPLAQIIDEAMQQVGGLIEQSKAQVSIQQELPDIHCDKPRLIEVYQNLIENAIRYKSAHRDPVIEIGVEQRGDDTVFFVQDNGIGIDPRYHEKIFGLFERLDLTHEGTGIGLAIVKRIIDVHGGKIWVDSDGEDRGSRFCFTLGKADDIPGGKITNA